MGCGRHILENSGARGKTPCRAGGGAKDSSKEDLAALERGAQNVLKHVDSLRNYGLDPVVALNRFPTDTPAEIARIEVLLKEMNVNWALSEVFARGGEGGKDLAEKVLKSLDKKYTIRRTYNVDDPVKDKIVAIARRVYGASEVVFEKRAERDLKNIESMGLSKVHVCMAKTQYSVSDDPKLMGWPKGFTVTVKSVAISSGAGFAVPMLGDIMTMPGLPTAPAAEGVDLTDDGEITGLF